MGWTPYLQTPQHIGKWNKWLESQLNYTSALNGDEPEATYIRTIIEGLQSELSFAIDMHSTVWKTSRTKYGCFHGVFNQEGANSPTIFRTYEWLYEFYNVKYPSIVQGNTVPNMLDNTYSSIGYGTTGFNHWILQKYGIQGSIMEFSDHVWSERLHTSEALSVAVNMYLNQIIQQLNDEYKKVSPTIDNSDWHPAKG